jgi:hypothetical protein
MQRRLTLFLTALALPCIANTTAPADKLAFGPAAGATLSRVWTIANEASLDDMQVSSNGNPVPLPGEMEMTQSMTNVIEVTDTIVEMRADAPKVLKRTFDKLSGDGSMSMTMPQMGDNSTEMSASSELEGKTVKFAWNEEEGQFDITYDGGEGDAELLEKLVEDMDLRDLLPGKEVAVGDTWAPEPNALRGLVAPGGSLAMKPKSEEGGMGGFGPGMDRTGDLASMLNADFEGKVSAEYKGIRDVEGAKLGEILITFDVKTAMDLTDEVADMAQDMPEGMGSMEVERMDIEFSWKGEATILWDVASGHVANAEAHGDQTMRVDSGMKMSMGGQNMSIETAMEMSGKVDTTLKVTRE